MTDRVRHGRCTCGAEVIQPLAGLSGTLLALAERVQLVCDRCAAEQDRLDREAAEARDQAERTKRHANRVKASGVPGALAQITFDDLALDERADAIAAAKAWAAGELPGLLLHGPVGVGKTRMAAAAAMRMLERRSLRWTSAPVLFARLGHGFGSQGREEALDVLIGAHPLVLDDLDKTRPTEFAAEHVFAAIDSRITEGIPLLVTTNLGSDQLEAKFPEPFGEAITSRLAGHTRPFHIDGVDRRLPDQESAHG